MKVIAVVGMTGSGKSEVAGIFRDKGYVTVRCGDVTDEEVRKLGIPLNEASERAARERIRQEYGMAAYAILNTPRIDNALKKSDVVVDGLYSWEEYIYLKENYGADLVMVAVWSSPRTRYTRLGCRRVRPLTADEAESRDRAEIQNLNKGGPIAMADFTICNESDLADLKSQVERTIERLK